MKKQRTYMILGIVLAGVGFLIAQSVLASANRSVQVVVAARPLEAGEELTEADITLKAIHPSAVLPDALTGVHEAVGQTIAVPRAKGEQIARSHLGRASSLKLEQGWRAVSVRVDARRGLAGKIKPGDRVAIVGVFRRETGFMEEEKLPLAKVLLRNVEVLFVTHSFVYRPPQEMQSLGQSSGGGLIPALPSLQKQSETGVVILKVPDAPVAIPYLRYSTKSEEVEAEKVGEVLVDPVELITYLDATDSLYLVLEPEEGPVVTGTAGLKLEDLFIPR